MLTPDPPTRPDQRPRMASWLGGLQLLCFRKVLKVADVLPRDPDGVAMGAAWSVVVRFAGPYVRRRMPTVSLLRLPELAVSWCPRGRSTEGVR